MIKYSWARYEGRPIHIDDVTKDMRESGEYFNLVTGKKMAAYIEGKFRRHFHHLVEDKMSKETYLHETAKLVFKDIYDKAILNNIPFNIEFEYRANCNRLFRETGVKCDLGLKTDIFDLTKVYDKCELEKRYDGFQPDIRLSSNAQPNDSIFIEIVVTHESSAKKLQSSHKVIEIKIRNDDDIKALRKNQISVLDSNTSFNNFRLKTIESAFCQNYDKGCRDFRKVFILYKNGTYEFFEYYLEHIYSDVVANSEKIKRVDFKASDKFLKHLKESENEEIYLKMNGIDLRQCENCRYVAHNKRIIGKKKYQSTLFCKFKKEDVSNKNAEKCDCFKK